MKLSPIHQTPEQQSQELLKGILEALQSREGKKVRSKAKLSPIHQTEEEKSTDLLQGIYESIHRTAPGVDPEELVQLIQRLIPPPIKGDSGETPNIDRVANMVQSRINLKKVAQQVAESLVLPVDEPDDLVEKLNQSKITIKPHRIEGLLEALYLIEQLGKYPIGQNVGGNNALIIEDSTGARLSDYVTVLKFSTGITSVYSGDGVVTLTVSGGGSGTTTSELILQDGTDVLLQDNSLILLNS